MTTDDLAAQRARLAEAEAALARLRGQYEVLMNRFKFDEAQAVAARIEAAERERTSRAADLPALSAVSPSTPYTVARRRRGR